MVRAVSVEKPLVCPVYQSQLKTTTGKSAGRHEGKYDCLEWRSPPEP